MKRIEWRGLEIPFGQQVQIQKGEESFVFLTEGAHTTPRFTALVKIKGCSGSATGSRDATDILDEALACCIHNLSEGLNMAVRFVVNNKSV